MLQHMLSSIPTPSVEYYSIWTNDIEPIWSGFSGDVKAAALGALTLIIIIGAVFALAKFFGK